MNCPHDLSDQDDAWADGLCAHCLRAEVERLRHDVERAQTTSSGLATDKERLRVLLREARTVVLPAWVGASPKPTHLAITPERQSLADRIDALLAKEKP